VMIGLVLLDLPLPSQATVLDGCGTCTRCLDACPTDAFAAPYVLDARRCISYLTIENPGAIEPNLRTSVGRHVFGCDVCQAVCPYNASRKLPPALLELRTSPQRDGAHLDAWLSLSSSDYRRLTQQSALRRAPRAQLQRNAAVALGNSKDRRAIPELTAALLHNDKALVRTHAAWALGQLAELEPEAVRHTLCQAQQTETDAAVRDEIAHLLAHLPSGAADTSG
jgi:epoxyqueuosine reductase